jgi:hypothetical protein
VWLLVLGGTVAGLAPKAPKPGDTSKFKYLHCDNETCRLELPYNKDMDGKRCPKCQTAMGKEGFLVPSERSFREGPGISPWTRVYVALFIETVAMLAAMTYMMYRPVQDPATTFFMIACPYCNQRLRYRAISHGGQGACSRCKRILRFPEEEDAVPEEEVLLADAAAAEAEAARVQAEAEGGEE